jgi:hypothetical protein
MNARMSGYMRTQFVTNDRNVVCEGAIMGQMSAHYPLDVIACIYVWTYEKFCVIDLLMTIPTKKKALLYRAT